jgi:hypothetical protein
MQIALQIQVPADASPPAEPYQCTTGIPYYITIQDCANCTKPGPVPSLVPSPSVSASPSAAPSTAASVAPTIAESPKPSLPAENPAEPKVNFKSRNYVASVKGSVATLTSDGLVITLNATMPAPLVLNFETPTSIFNISFVGIAKTFFAGVAKDEIAAFRDMRWDLASSEALRSITASAFEPNSTSATPVFTLEISYSSEVRTYTNYIVTPSQIRAVMTVRSDAIKSKRVNLVAYLGSETRPTRDAAPSDQFANYANYAVYLNEKDGVIIPTTFAPVER